MLRTIKSYRSWGLLVSPPPSPLGHPPTLRLPFIRLTRLLKGGQGDTPLGMPPHLGERGGDVRIFLINEKINKIRFSTEPNNNF